MEFSIEKSHFQKGLQALSRLSASRMPLPILNNVLIEVTETELSLLGTDLEYGLAYKMPVKATKSGKFTVPNRLLTEYISNTADKQLEIKLIDNASLSIKGESSGVKLRGLDASEYPELPFIKGQPLFHLKGDELKQAIEMTIFATAIDDTRPILAGLSFKADKGVVTIAATDSFRLAEQKLKILNQTDGSCSVIVPKKSCLDLARLISEAPGDISVFVGDNQIQFGFGPITLVSRLIDGNYPDYQAILPNSYQTRITAHHGDLTASLKLASLFSKDSGNVIRLIAEPGAGMTVESIADQKGEVRSRLTAIVEGEPLTITFNVRYLLDALGVVKSDNVFLEFTDIERPVMVKPTNTKESFSLVMPLKVDANVPTS